MANIPFESGLHGQPMSDPILRAQRPQGAAHPARNTYVNAPEARPNALKSIFNISAAGLSVMLIGGVAIWAYNLMTQDVSGLPVVRAIQGEMRVLPENPGGQLTQNQGLSVNSVAVNGASTAEAQKLQLAPQPVELHEEDLSLSVAPKPQGDLSGIDPNSSVAELLNELGMAENIEIAHTDPKALKTPKPSGISTQPQEKVAVQLASATSTPLVQLSLRPNLRPANLLKQASLQAPVKTPADLGSEVDPATLPAGTRLVQVGAFDSPAIARRQWDHLKSRFGEFLHDKKRVIQQTQSNGRIFYRLRVMGFADLPHARQFCSAFKAKNVDCIPVVTK